MQPDDSVSIDFCARYISAAWNETFAVAQESINNYAKRKDGSFCFIAKLNRTPIGMIVSFHETGLTIVESYVSSSKHFSSWVAGLYVEESQRGRGLAGRLLKTAVDKIFSEGFTKVHLGVDVKKGHLNEWYLRLGWTIVGKASDINHLYDVMKLDK